jgi:phage protein D
MPAPLAGAFEISVAGSPLPAELAPDLASILVEDNLNLPDLVVVRLRDPHRTAIKAASARVGAPLSVSVVGPGSATPVPLVDAEITAVEAEIDSTGTYTIIRGFDPAHRLFRGRHTETYQQVTSSDVARKVASRAGLPTGTIDPSSTVHTHLSQGGVSDWQFLSALAREIGYEVAVRKGKLDFRKPVDAAGAPPPTPDASGSVDPGPLVLQQGSNLLRLRATVTSAEQVSTVEVRGWDVATKKALVGTTPARTTSAELPATTPVDLAKAVGDRTYVATDVPYGTQAEVDAAAHALAEQIAGAFAEMEGQARGDPRIRAGAAVSVDSLGEPFDGRYVVTTSRHVWTPAGGYVTHFSVTGRQERSLYGLASGGTGLAGPRSAPGVVVGQVSDVRDPQHLGRVAVRFPWLSDDYVSDWARTVQPGAGKDRGAQILPEVGDEVLVAFEQGDFRRPYVLGGLYNGVDGPKSGGGDLVDGSGAVGRRTFVSRTGHRIDLHDANGGKDGIALASGDGKLTLTLDASGTTVKVHSEGTVTIESTRGVTIDAGNGNVSISGQQVDIKASAGLTLDGGPQTSVKSSGQMTIDGGGMTTVKGGMVRIN